MGVDSDYYNLRLHLQCKKKLAVHKSECQMHAARWCDLNKPNLASGSGLKWVTGYFQCNALSFSSAHACHTD